MLRKRRGTTTLAANAPDTGTPIGPVRLANHNGQILVCSEEGIWTVAANGDRLEQLDAMPSTVLDSVVSLGHYTAVDVVACSCAETSAFRVWTWATGVLNAYQLHALVLDLERGAGSAATMLLDGVTDTGVKCLKAIAIGSKVTLFWGVNSNEIRYYDITSATQLPTLTSIGTVLVSDAVQTKPQWFDVSPHGSGYCLVYRTSATQYNVKRYNSSHVVQSSGTFTPAAGFGTSPRFGICGDTNGIAVAVAHDGATCLSLFWYDDTITQTATQAATETAIFGTGAVNLDGLAICRYSSAGTVAFCAQATATALGSEITRIGTLTQGGTLAITGTMQDTTIASKPWVYSGDVYAQLRFRGGVNANSYYCVVRFTGGASSILTTQYPVLEAAYLTGLASADTMLADCASCVSQSGAGIAVMTPRVDRYSGPAALTDPTGQNIVTGTGFRGTQIMVNVGVDGYLFNHARRDRWQAVQVGQYTCFSGGIINKFDGRRCTEIGFASFPYPTISTLASGGAINDGTYSIGVIWEWMDYNGNVEQSAPWTQGNITVSGGDDNQINLLVNTLAHSAKEWRMNGSDERYVSLAYYRTITDDDGVDGTILYRVEGPGADRFPTATLTSPTTSTAPSVSYNDDNDADVIQLDTRPVIYSSDLGAQELPNMMPPPSNVLCSHESRLFFVLAETPNVVGYTKQQFPGSALAWNSSLIVIFDCAIVAMASQDGNLVCFGEDRIYTLTPRPADNTGQSTGYDPPVLLSGQLGCASRRSVVASPVGIFFESKRGIEVLPRGGSVPEFIGAKVRETFDAYPVITSTLHVPHRSEVWIAVVDTETTAGIGRVLVFDYDNKVWLTRNYQNRPIVDMCLDGADVVLGIYNSASGLTLWKEDGGFDDANGSFVAQRIRFGDLRFAGANGSQTVNEMTLFGEVAGVCKVRTGESVNSGSSWRYKNPKHLAVTSQLRLQHQTFQRKAGEHAFEIIESQADAGPADSEGFALAVMRVDGQGFGQSSRLAGNKRI